MAPKEPDTPSATGACGHTVWEYEHPTIGSFAFGAAKGPRFGRMARFFSRTTEKCGNCRLQEVLKDAACCAGCGNPILVGMPVSILVHPEPTTEVIPFLAYATRPTDTPNAFVFCMNCAPGPVAMTGYWTGTGVQQPDISPMEMLLSGEASMVMVTSDGRIISTS